MSDLEFLVDAQNLLGEGPVWHPVENVLYWVDILQDQLHRFDPTTGEHSVTQLELTITAMGVRATGGFVVATKKGFALYDPRKNAFSFICDPDPDQGDARFNDGKTDRQGRFWAGKMSSQSTNSLFRLNPDYSVERMESQIGISNGLGWSPDNRTFYFTDTPANAIYAYDFDPELGSISNRRIFTSIPNAEGEGGPDGLAIDSEGCIWSARWGGWKVVRYTPDGQVEREIRFPAQQVTSCAFGGPNLDELYITTALVGLNRTDQPQSGGVFRLKTGVRGLPEPIFGG